jgi:hypothetical protein
MSLESADLAAESGRRVIAAIRSGLAGFGPTGSLDGASIDEMLTFVNSASSSDVYHLVALAAATIRWASHETGRSEAEIVAELAENYAADRRARYVPTSCSPPDPAVIVQRCEGLACETLWPWRPKRTGSVQRGQHFHVAGASAQDDGGSAPTVV